VTREERGRLFAVLGAPIGHSRSPLMHTAAFEALGLPHMYVALQVLPPELGTVLRSAAVLGFGGVNLTVPHKQAALDLMDGLSPEVQRIGALNTVCFKKDRLVGHNTDGIGFMRALDELRGPPLRQVMVLGTGGASLAVVDALLEGTFGGQDALLDVVWVSRNPKGVRHAFASHARVKMRGYEWLARRGGSFSGTRGARPFQLLVNTSIVGMGGGPKEFPQKFELSFLEPGSRVVDLVYPRPAGGLLDRAEARGMTVQSGLPMLQWQGLEALQLWLNRPLGPDIARLMRDALGLKSS